MFYDILGEEDERNPLLSDANCTSSEQGGNSSSIRDRSFTNLNSGGIASNFNTLCVAFSLNHAVVVTCLAFSTTLLGNNLGSFILGVLYVCFAVAAFFFSNVFVLNFGSRESLMLGLIGYTIQATVFFVCLVTFNISSVLTWIIAIPAYIIGGFAAGIVWTAQGRMYRLHSKLYAEVTGQNLSHVNSQFAAVFTTYFLGFETCLKLLATVMYFLISHRAEYIIFLFYAVLAWISCFIATRIEDLDDPPSGSMNTNALAENAALTGRLLYKDLKLVLLVPFQISFGLTASMMMYYIFGTVIAGSATLGAAYVGFFSAVVVLAGAVVAAPMSKIADSQGKAIVILFGNLSLLLCGLVVLLFSDETIGTWLFMIPFSIIFGLGRGVWENTNKAVIADFYQNNATNCTAAFSVAAFFNGYASSIGYFTFLYVPRHRMAQMIIFSAAISCICSQMSFVVQLQQEKEESWKTKKIEMQRRNFQEHKVQKDKEAFEKFAKEGDVSTLL